MSEDASDGADSLEDGDEGLQVAVARLRKSRNKLRQQNKALQTQLERTLAWCEQLRLQVEELNGKLAQVKPCLNCAKSKSKKRDIIEENGHVETQSKKKNRGTQTSEDGIAEMNLLHTEIKTEKLEEQDWQASEDGGDCTASLAEKVRLAAESTLTLQGMVLEATSGLYYDYSSGYYYDAEKSLYYDGHTGTYLTYDRESQAFNFHSALSPEEVEAQKVLRLRAEEMKKHTVLRKPGGDKTTDPGTQFTNGEKEEETEALQESSIPCIRLIVTWTEDERVETGSLFVVTYKGGSIGSKGEHEVLLADLGCSKNHADISFNMSDCQYYLRDLGSRNGTWINNKRLSPSKEPSQDTLIGHGTCIQIGKTKLLCHVHPGTETCLECEPGLVRAAAETTSTPHLPAPPSREQQRKSNLKDLKRKYGLGPASDTGAPGGSESYVDRADERRRQHGVDPLHAKTEMASLDTAISKENRGYGLLQKMGWQAGSGLGIHGQGQTEPVAVEAHPRLAGLGSESAVPPVPLSLQEKRKNEIWKKTRKRFKATPLLEAFAESSEDEDTSKKAKSEANYKNDKAKSDQSGRSESSSRSSNSNRTKSYDARHGSSRASGSPRSSSKSSRK